jgi:hypothetical protein
MADPRAAVELVGIGYKAITMQIDASTITYSATAANGSAQVGLAVVPKVGSPGVIELAGDGEGPVMKLISVDSDGYATVQHKGICTLPGGTGATLTIGERIVGDLLSSAEGYIQAVATGTAAQLGHANGVILDASDTAAVVVDLG